MTLFDKVLINIHKGFEKFKRAAALFSERIKVEMGIIRGRIRMSDIQGKIDETYASIGRKLVELREKESLPKTLEQFTGMDDVAVALADMARLKKDLEDIKTELAGEQEAFKTAAKQSEEGAK